MEAATRRVGDVHNEYRIEINLQMLNLEDKQIMSDHNTRLIEKEI